MKYIRHLKNIYTEYSEEIIRLSILPIIFFIAKIVGYSLIVILSQDNDIFKFCYDKLCTDNGNFREDLFDTYFLNVLLILIYFASILKINYRSFLVLWAVFYLYSSIEYGINFIEVDGALLTRVTNINSYIFEIKVIFLIFIVYVFRKGVKRFGSFIIKNSLVQSIIYFTIITAIPALIMMLFSLNAPFLKFDYLYIIWLGLIFGMVFHIRIYCLKYLYPMVVVGLTIAYTSGFTNYYYPYLPHANWSTDFIFTLFVQSLSLISPIIFNEIVSTLVNKIDNKVIYDEIR